MYERVVPPQLPARFIHLALIGACVNKFRICLAEGAASFSRNVLILQREAST